MKKILCLLFSALLLGCSAQNIPEEDWIVLNEPLEGESVACPLHVSGEARGYWYFEASFPVELRGESGELLASGIATALGDWMTEDFVPFELDLSYNTEGEAATLILMRNNASGLPENDRQLEVAVQLEACGEDLL